MHRSRSSLRGAVIVITGGSSGNGRAAARAFAQEGSRLVLAARREEALREAADECERLGGQAMVVPTDVSDPEAVEELGRRAIAAFGHIDVWINNAGVMHAGRLDETPARVLHRVIETNLLGCIHGAQVALRHFRQRGRGILINVSSVVGTVGAPYGGAYVASKFAIRGHTIKAVKPTYDPGVVVDAMLRLARHPRREVYAGAIGYLAAMQKAVAPALTERIVSAVASQTEIGQEKAPPSDGNLFEPA